MSKVALGTCMFITSASVCNIQQMIWTVKVLYTLSLVEYEHSYIDHLLYLFQILGCGKFALRGLSQCLAKEFHPLGVHIAHIIIDGVIGASR